MSEIELVEVKDGLLESPDKVIMKAREPGLFPQNIREFFSNKKIVSYQKIVTNGYKVIVFGSKHTAEFNSEFFKYIESLGQIKFYLSNISLPNTGVPCYPLFARYRYGWICLAPLEVII